MAYQKRRPMLEPVLENNCIGPPISLTRQPSAQYRPHKYGAPLKVEPQCTCLSLGLSPLSFFGKLRDRYIKAMNEMAMGGDFTGVTGFCSGAPEHEYTLQHSRSIVDRGVEALQEESAALTRSKSQARML